METTIWGSQTHEERVAGHLKRLREASVASVVELAATTPGGPMDAPFAPINPALHAAAQYLVNEAGLQDEVVQLLRET